MNFRGPVLAAVFSFTVAVAGTATAADAFPQKPIRLLVGYGPGSGADLAARLVGSTMQDSLKQSVIVENKSGAGGSIAAAEVARATPDGYTLLLGAMPQIAILPAISKVAYDVDKDFKPVSQIGGTGLVLGVNPEKVPSESVEAFVKWAKEQSLLFFGTPGAGTVGHFGSALAGDTFGVKVEPIHYRNVGDQLAALVNGDIHAQFFSYGAALPLVQSGRVKALMDTSPQRSAMFPDVPTARELGYNALEFTSWYGIFAPAGTPDAIRQKLSAEVAKAAQSPDTKQKLEEIGLVVTGTSSDAFATVIQDDVERWRKVIDASGFKQE